jgi:hypothetical protein
MTKYLRRRGPLDGDDGDEDAAIGPKADVRSGRRARLVV